MRSSIVYSFALLAAACASSALAQQFSIATNDIFDGSGSVNNYNGPVINFDDVGAVIDGGYGAFAGWMYHANPLGFMTNRRVDTLSSINVYRHIDTFTNLWAGPQTVNLSLLGNFGSSASVIVRNDAYAFVGHDSNITFNTGAPVIGLMNGNNAWAAANITRSLGPIAIAVDYTLTLQPGESITLMYATFLARDITDRSGDAALAQSTVNAMLADPMGTGLYTGLTQAEINSIVNWTVPTPGAAALLGLGGLASLRRRRP